MVHRPTGIMYVTREILQLENSLMMSMIWVVGNNYNLQHMNHYGCSKACAFEDPKSDSKSHACWS